MGLRQAGLALAIWLLSAMGARAEPPPGSNTPPSAEALQAVDEMFSASHFDQTMDRIAQSITGQIVQAELRRYRNLTSEERDAFLAATADALRSVEPDIIHNSEVIYARMFTVQQLHEIRDFYLSPTGQALLASVPRVMAETTEAMRPLTPRIEQELMASLCRRIDCRALTPAQQHS